MSAEWNGYTMNWKGTQMKALALLQWDEGGVWSSLVLLDSHIHKQKCFQMEESQGAGKRETGEERRDHG